MDCQTLTSCTKKAKNKTPTLQTPFSRILEIHRPITNVVCVFEGKRHSDWPEIIDQAQII